MGAIGTSNQNWRGDKVGYKCLHKWIIRHKGKASYCSFDLNHNGKYEWSNISGKYKRDLDDYRPLCIGCHRKIDLTPKKLKQVIDLQLEISRKKRITIMQYTKDNKFVNEYNSISEASKLTSIDSSDIVRVAKSKRSLAGGFIWRYKQ